LAMHAAILADQPLQLAGFILVFGKAHQRPAVGRQIARVVIDADVLLHLAAQVVPFVAGGLAGLAADADRHVDQLGDLHLVVADLRRGGGGTGGRAADGILRVHASAPSAFSTLTRNALNSGVCEFASPTPGASVLAR